MHPRIWTKLLLAGLLLNLVACGPARKRPEGAPEKMRLSQLTDRVNNAENRFDNLRIRATGEIHLKDIDQRFRIELRLRHDSLIWADLADPILGIKVARALITPDSLHFFNRLDKSYFSGSTQMLRQQYGIAQDFAALQALFSANLLFSPGQISELRYLPGAYQLANFKPERDTASLRGPARIAAIEPRFFKPERQHEFSLDPPREYEVSYENLREIEPGLVFPKKLTLRLVSPQEALLVLDIQKVESNDPRLNYPYTIPPNYGRTQ